MAKKQESEGTNLTSTPATPATLAERMLQVMTEVSYVQKDEKKIDNKYRAVTHDAVIAKLRPSLVKNGILVLVDVKDHKITDTWEASSYQGKKTRYSLTEVTTAITFVNAFDSQDREIIHSFGYGIDNQDKGPGKAISYSVKTGLLKTFCLETGDDPDQDQGDNYDVPGDRSHKPNIATDTPANMDTKPRETQDKEPIAPKKAFKDVMADMQIELGDSDFCKILGQEGYEKVDEIPEDRAVEKTVFHAMNTRLKEILAAQSE